MTRDEAAKRRLLKENNVEGNVVVTQQDLLAQIGAQTVEITVLKTQLQDAHAIIQSQAARIAELDQSRTGEAKTVELVPEPEDQYVEDPGAE